MNEAILDSDHLKNIVKEQARIALVNYDAAQKNHDNLRQLTDIVAQQSKQVAVLISIIGDLLEELANQKKRV